MKPRIGLYLSLAALAIGLTSFVGGLVVIAHERFVLFEVAMWSSGVGLLLGLVAFIISLRAAASRKALVCSLLAMLLSCPLSSFALLSHLTIRLQQDYAQKHTLVPNMKILLTAIQSYAQTHKGRLPDADTWAASLMQQDSSLGENTFRHPENPAISIAYNANLSGLQLSNVLADIVLFFEAKGPHALGGTQGLLDTLDGTNIADVMLIDGRVQQYWLEHAGVRAYNRTFVSLRWKP